MDIRQIEDIEVEGVDSRDYPEFCDAFFAYATWKNTGIELTEDELIELSDQYPDVLNDMAYQSLI